MHAQEFLDPIFRVFILKLGKKKGNEGSDKEFYKKFEEQVEQKVVCNKE